MSLEARLRQRPLSPHLAIYRRTTTMMISFVHRLTGTALYLGTLLLTWCLIAAAEGPKSYPLFESCIGSAAGKFVLFGYSRANSSSSGSLRHFVWDFGQGCALASGAQLGGGDDGLFARSGSGAPLLWDLTSKSAVDASSIEANPALIGEFVLGDVPAIAQVIVCIVVADRIFRMHMEVGKERPHNW